MAYYANNPVIEADLFSRHLWLINQGKEKLEKGLLTDPEYYDAKIAGWWVWGLNAWIGGGWCTGEGAWNVDENNEIIKTKGVNRQMPHLGNAGKGVNTPFNLEGSHQKHLDNLISYLQSYADRLRYVRILNGDWSRLTGVACSAYKDTGIFLDPPYDGYSEDMYQKNFDNSISADVRNWAIANGDKYKIVLAGYSELHEPYMPSDWQRYNWSARISYGSKKGKNNTEMLWASPLCNLISKPNTPYLI